MVRAVNLGRIVAARAAPSGGAIGDRGSRIALLALACAFPVVYLGLALFRVRYPFALEWVESGVLDGVRRLTEGHPLYGPPTLDYVPFNYPPLYYYASAPIARWLGVGFPALRLVSFVASLGCLALVFAIARHVTRSGTAATLAAACYAAAYEATGAWYDLARADSLHVFLLLGGFACLVLDASRVRGPVLAGLLLGLSFLAKQSALTASIPLAAYLLATRPASGLAFAGAMAAVIVGSTIAFDHASGGWYRYYVFTLPSRSPVQWAWLPYFWIHDAGRMGFAMVVGIAYLLLAPPGPVAGGKALFGAWGLGLLLSSWWVRLYVGAGENNVMPLAAGVAVLFGLGWSEVSRRCREAPEALGRLIATLFQLACAMQFLGLGYYPLKYVPRSTDVAAGNAVVQALRGLPGDVLVPFHGYLAVMAGKPEHFHAMAMAAVNGVGRGEVAERLQREYDEAIRARRYSAIILDESQRKLGEATPGYELSGPLLTDPDVFWTRNGSKARPELVYRPRASPQAAGP